MEENKKNEKTQYSFSSPRKSWDKFRDNLPRRYNLDDGIIALIDEFNANVKFRDAVLKRLQEQENAKE